MNIKETEKHIRGLSVATCEDLDRVGLRATPARVAQVHEEAVEGIKYTNGEIAGTLGETLEVSSDSNTSGAVVIKGSYYGAFKDDVSLQNLLGDRV